MEKAIKIEKMFQHIAKTNKRIDFIEQFNYETLDEKQEFKLTFEDRTTKIVSTEKIRIKEDEFAKTFYSTDKKTWLDFDSVYRFFVARRS